MPFCANCGASVEGRFCARCGTALPDSGPNPGSSPSSGPSGAAGSALPENAAAALCYVLTFITGILFLTLEPYSRNRTVRFHAWQAILLGAAWFGVWILETMLAIIMPGILLPILWGVVFLVFIGLVIIWLILMFKAYNGEKFVLPVIGPIAESKA